MLTMVSNSSAFLSLLLALGYVSKQQQKREGGGEREGRKRKGKERRGEGGREVLI